MHLVRYSARKSESGAYIFAPNKEAERVDLDPLDLVVFQHDQVS